MRAARVRDSEVVSLRHAAQLKRGWILVKGCDHGLESYRSAIIQLGHISGGSDGSYYTTSRPSSLHPAAHEGQGPLEHPPASIAVRHYTEFVWPVLRSHAQKSIGEYWAERIADVRQARERRTPDLLVLAANGGQQRLLRERRGLALVRLVQARDAGWAGHLTSACRR